MEKLWQHGSGQFIFWRYLIGVGCLLHTIPSVYSSGDSDLTDGAPQGNVSSHAFVTIAGLKFEELARPFIITCFVMFAMLSKLAYHHAGILSSLIPESCVQIFLGIIIGAIIYFSGFSDTFPDFFTPHEFFVYLLPPIVLEAAYSLNDSTFYDNIGSVLIYAVLGTLLNCFLIGFTLWGLSLIPSLGIVKIGLLHILVFTSIIVAVDPVAVLAIFSEMGVNATLYILVFGESLLNDGISVVLYSVMQTYSVMDELPAGQIFLGVLKFIVVVIGGLSIGIIIGMLSALLTKYTFHVRVVEPIMVFGSAFLSYILADIFELSGIISLIGCGLAQAQYALHNVNRKSEIAIKYCIKVASTTSEIIIFLFLGMALVRYEHEWSTGFTVSTIILCLIYRFIVVYSLTYFINKFDRYRVRKIGLDEQFIMSYGGLRGAVCFSLVMMLDKDVIPAKRMFVTTTLSVIIFTILIQGITIKPLVKLLKVTLQKKNELNCLVFLTSDVCDHLMAGMEDIIGFHGKYYLKELLEYYDDHYLKKRLQRKPTKADAEISKVYEKIMLRDHFKTLEMSGVKNFPDQAKKDMVAAVPPEISLLDKENKPGSLYMDTWLSLYHALKAKREDTDRTSYQMEPSDRHYFDYDDEQENESHIPLQDIKLSPEPANRTPRFSIFGKLQTPPSILTSEDVRNILRQKSTPRNAYQEKFDRDLAHDDDEGFEHYMGKKRRMTEALAVMHNRRRSSFQIPSAQESQADVAAPSSSNVDIESASMPQTTSVPQTIVEEPVDIEDAIPGRSMSKMEMKPRFRDPNV